MEKFQEYREKAKRNLEISDHMLNVTFLLVKDPKLLLAVIENIFLAYTNSMNAILLHDWIYKKIPGFNETFESKLNMFQARSIDMHKLDKKYITDMRELRNLLLEHKKSPIEFSRQGKLVICSDSYQIKTIEQKELAEYINKAKVFIHEMTSIIAENERIFGKRRERA
jgi:hypothetical protein